MMDFRGRSLLLSALLLSAGCIATGSIDEEGDKIVVDDSKAGIVTYDRIVKDAVEQLLEDYHQKIVGQGQEKPLIAFVGIQNKGSEELGEARGDIFEKVETVVFQSGYFRIVAKKAVDIASRAAGLRSPDELLLASKREAFLEQLSANANPPDLLMYGTMTTITSSAKGYFRDTKQRRYTYVMEMIDANTGELAAKVSGDSSKTYRK